MDWDDIDSKLEDSEEMFPIERFVWDRLDRKMNPKTGKVTANQMPKLSRILKFPERLTE